MKLTALIFSYRNDQKLAWYCAKFVKLVVPDAHIVIADDGFCAATYEWQQKYKQLGFDYRQTDWYRNKNLTGAEHLIGATALMAELAKDCDIILKIDPDACLIRSDWIETLYQTPNAVITSAYKTSLNYPMGNSYAVKASVCEELAKDAKLYPGWINCFEDYEIGQRIARMFPNDPSHAIRYNCNISEGFILTSPYDFNLNLCLNKCRVYCHGFQYNSFNTVDERRNYKSKQEEVHETLYKNLFKFKGIFGEAMASEMTAAEMTVKSIQEDQAKSLQQKSLEENQLPDGGFVKEVSPEDLQKLDAQAPCCSSVDINGTSGGSLVSEKPFAIIDKPDS